jgi:endonuclease YncB( thermonuclease family)
MNLESPSKEASPKKSKQETTEPTLAQLEQAYADAQAEARAAHDGLFSGRTSEGDLDLAYRREADAKAALEARKAREKTS